MRSVIRTCICVRYVKISCGIIEDERKLRVVIRAIKLRGAFARIKCIPNIIDALSCDRVIKLVIGQCGEIRVCNKDSCVKNRYSHALSAVAGIVEYVRTDHR